MEIRRSLSLLERMCVYCSKSVDIKKDDYIATYSYRIRGYRVAHKECYNKYLEYVKNSWR